MMKKVLAALLAVCMLASLMFIPASAAGFDDVADDHWAKEAIDRWAGYGVLNGKGEGKFDPDANMTRAQFAKFIVTLMGLPTDSTEMPFEDVMGSADEWAAPYIAAAHKAGIINGKSTTRFAPRDNVTFDQSAAMMARAVGLVEPSAFGDAVTEKLTELGMLDDNVKPDADPTRALVAGLADNIIEYYANDAEADAVVVGGTEEATEVKGVILAVNGGKVEVENATVKAPIVVTSEASVEVKSSTVEAPIVVDSASVALTETKAENVVVSGTEASVTADKESSVKEVAVTGTAPSVELNGEVEKVTVAEGTTEVAISGDGVSSENVTNNTGADITVNDETVEPTPAEPDPEKPGESTGFVPEPSTPVEQPEAEEKPDAATPTVPTADKGTVTQGTAEGASDPNECDGHEWGDAATTQAATCTEDGTATYTCSNCKGVSTVTIPKLGHNWYKKAVTPATCTEQGTITWACANSESCKKFGTGDDATNDEKFAALGHTQVNFAGQAATCTNYGLGTGIMCGREDCDMHHVISAGAPASRTADTITLGTTEPTITASKWFVAPTVLRPLGHNYQATETGEDGVVTEWTCSRCDDEIAICPNNANHDSYVAPATCPVCHAAGTGVAHDPETHTTLAYDSSKAATDSGHYVKCSADHCSYSALEAHKNWVPDAEKAGNTKCGVCNYSKACPGHQYDKETGSPTGKCTLCGHDCDHGNTAAGEQCGTCGKTLPAAPVANPES